jgi:acetylornithine/succinyldiaminopimelate/putrescine aminotransferase
MPPHLNGLWQHGRELAAVITEPIMANMGCILPRDGYLQRLRELTQEYGVLLILDEVVTGFRYAPGGCQEYYGVTPDISTLARLWARVSRGSRGWAAVHPQPHALERAHGTAHGTFNDTG